MYQSGAPISSARASECNSTRTPLFERGQELLLHDPHVAVSTLPSATTRARRSSSGTRHLDGSLVRFIEAREQLFGDASALGPGKPQHLGKQLVE